MKETTLDVFQVIADPSRRKMLALLTEESLSINGLAENFSMSRPAVSKHVKVLYQAGFISISDVGRERFCSLKPDGFNALQSWLAYFDQFWSSRLNKLDALLKTRRAD